MLKLKHWNKIFSHCFVALVLTILYFCAEYEYSIWYTLYVYTNICSPDITDSLHIHYIVCYRIWNFNIITWLKQVGNNHSIRFNARVSYTFEFTTVILMKWSYLLPNETFFLFTGLVFIIGRMPMVCNIDCNLDYNLRIKIQASLHQHCRKPYLFSKKLLVKNLRCLHDPPWIVVCTCFWWRH